MSLSGIYMIENLITHHLYIGKSKNIEHRWSEHLSDAQNHKDKYPIHLAIQKYGQENFKFSILEIMNEEEYLQHSNEREIYWIKYYNTYLNKEHYNLTPGGDGGKDRKLTKEQKDNISKKLKQYYQTPEGQAKAKKQSLYMQEHPITTHNPHTEEWKKGHSKRMTGENNPNFGKHGRGKKCRCIETQKVYDSTRQAAEEIGVAHTGIAAACRGAQQTSGGFHWEYI